MSEPKPLASLNGSLLARKGSAKPAMRSQLMQPYVPVSTHGTEKANPLEDLGWNDMGEAHGHNQAEILQLTPAPINREAKAESKAEDRIAAAQLAENAQRMVEPEDDDDDLPPLPAVKPMVVLQQEEIASRMTESFADAAEDDDDQDEDRQDGNEDLAFASYGYDESDSAAQDDDPFAAADDFAPVLQTKRPKAGKRKARRRSALDDGRRAAFTLRLDSDRHLKLRLACTVRNRSAQQIVTEALDRLIDAMPEIESLAAQVKRH